jgi:hypothetical protein
VEPDEFAIAPAYDAFPFAGAAMPGPEVAQAQTVDQTVAQAQIAPVEAPAVRADADSIAALEAELGAIESELHALDHDAH